MLSKVERVWLAIIVAFTGLLLSLYFYNVSKADVLSDEELYIVWSESKQSTDVTQRTTKNSIGTYDYIMVASARLHNSQTVHMSFGFEISMLNEDNTKDNWYVNPKDGKYYKYNSARGQTTGVGGYNPDTDPHYYTSNNRRVSFIVNNYLVSSGSTALGTGKNMSAGTIVRNGTTYSVWCIGENIVHQGIKNASSDWNKNYEAWLNDRENVQFAFGWDNVRTGTYSGQYLDMYTSTIYESEFRGLANKINDLADDLYDGQYRDKVWITKSPHKKSQLAYPTTVFSDGAYAASQASRCNGRYNYRRRADGWGYSLSGGYSPHYSETNDQWDLYKADPYLMVDNYSGRVMTWKNYASDGTFGNMADSYFKRYFVSASVVLPEEPVTKPVVRNKIVLTKNEGNTNIYVGIDDSKSYSGNMYSAPEVYTYNVDDVTEDGSETFDIGDAIPTTESYRNYIEEDKWYGDVEIEKVDYEYTFTGSVQAATTYNWTNVTSGEILSEETDSEGEPLYRIPYTIRSPQSQTYTYTYHPQYTWKSTNYDMAFYRISDLDLYELQSSYTLNYSTGQADYDLTNVSKVPYSVRINNVVSSDTNEQVIAPTQRYLTASDWMNKTSYLKYSSLGTNAYKKIFNYSEAGTNRTINLGDNPSSVPSGVDGDAASRAQNFYNKYCNRAGLFEKHNDIFNIAGYSYLVDDPNDYKKGIAEQCKPYFGNTYEMNETSSAYEKAYANSVRTIDTKIKNGEYYTDVEAMYRHIVTSYDTRELYVGDIAEQVKAAIKNEEKWLHNEPIVVFSPVMSPIHINAGDSTQLVNKLGEKYGISQMRLDGTYDLQFDWEAYFSQKGYGNPAGYTRYIDEKYLSFPFSVYINDKYYEPDNTESGYGAGYTEWIPVGATTTSVKIYIPTWANEGLYGGNLYGLNRDDYYAVNNRPIEVRVEANNVPEALVMAGEAEYNTNVRSDNHYVSTFELATQISGWIYEFEINSVYDYKNFAPSDWVDRYGVGIYSFTERTDDTNYKETEKRVGTYNRLGSKIGAESFTTDQRANVRYTQDGYMTGNWLLDNTLALAQGKNPNGRNSGYLVKGNTIAFTLKTIANLNTANDSINIKPDYRYYDLNAHETPNIDVYYLGVDGALVKMGSEKDLESVTKISLGDFPDYIFYEDAYYDYFYDTLKQTAFYDLQDENNIQQILTTSSACYSVGDITMNSNLRLISGNEEELVANLTWLNNAEGAIYHNTDLVMAAPLRYSLVGTQGNKYNLTKDEYGYVPGDVYDSSYANMNFKNSMQTWYGQYKIPSDILVCPEGAVEKYLEEGGESIDGTEDFWLDDGYLVLNFDIESKQDGNDHLQYFSSTDAGMWGNEKGKDTTDPDPSEDPNTHIPEKPGDIGIIPLKYNSVKQHHDIGILYLN